MKSHNARAVIGLEGNYFGDVIRRQIFPAVIAAETTYKDATTIPEHHHQFPGFFLVLQGTFETCVRRRLTVSRSGDAGFHSSGESHSVRLLTRRGRGFNIELPNWPGNGTSEKAGDWNLGTTRVPQLLLQIYREFCLMDVGSPLAIEGLVLQLKAELIRRRDTLPPGEPAWLRKVEEFLYSNVCNRIGMDDLGRVCGENPRNVAHAFHRLRGCTPAAYQRRARIAIAQRKLSETNDAIASIAAETGFFDQAHFSHQFKAMVGHTPLRYRQLLRRHPITRITKFA